MKLTEAWIYSGTKSSNSYESMSYKTCSRKDQLERISSAKFQIDHKMKTKKIPQKKVFLKNILEINFSRKKHFSKKTFPLQKNLKKKYFEKKSSR